MTVTMITTIPFHTTTSISIAPLPLSSSFSSFHFHCLVTGSRTSETKKYVNGFSRRKSTPTDDNLVLSSKFDDDEVPYVVSTSLDSASEVVRKFYDGINSRNISSVVDLIAEDCVYDDLVFPQPFVGRKAILEFFEKFIYSISRDLQFAIDDISGEDTSAVGVTWHLEWKGKPFPFSKGCSFYRLEVVEGSRKIIYGRDIVEPAVKPGDLALVAIRGVTWLLQRFPQLAERL